MIARRRPPPPTGPEKGGARVAFAISADLRRRCEEVLAAVREDGDPRPHVDELAAVVVEMTDAGLDFYFLLPLELAEAGAVARGTARVGIAAARRGIPTVIRRVVASLSDDQLLRIVDFIDDILVR